MWNVCSNFSGFVFDVDYFLELFRKEPQLIDRLNHMIGNVELILPSSDVCKPVEQHVPPDGSNNSIK